MPADSDKGRQWKRDVEAIANVCGNFNDLFNHHTFVDACGATNYK